MVYGKYMYNFMFNFEKITKTFQIGVTIVNKTTVERNFARFK